MYPGRVILCLGAGAPADLKAAGIESPKPLVAIGEAVTICRQLFAGGMADFHGQAFDVSGRRLANGGRDIPIVIAASRSAMLKRAGRDSDGVLISAATSPPFVKACLDQAAPATARSFLRAGIVYTRLGPAESIRRPIGFVLRGAHHAENIRLGGASLDQAALAAAYAAENWSEVDRLVSDDVVRRHAACGTPGEVRAKLEEYRSIGLDEVIIGGMEDASSIAQSLKAATS
jgi:5,10-methylenetetrahydromethanopterin reductase